jgi:hypothetical protein
MGMIAPNNVDRCAFALHGRDAFLVG